MIKMIIISKRKNLKKIGVVRLWKMIYLSWLKGKGLELMLEGKIIRKVGRVPGEGWGLIMDYLRLK